MMSRRFVSLFVAVSSLLAFNAFAGNEIECLRQHDPEFRPTQEERTWENAMLNRHAQGVDALNVDLEAQGMCFSAPKIYGDNAKDALAFVRYGLGQANAIPAYISKKQDKHAIWFVFGQDWGWDQASCTKYNSMRLGYARAVREVAAYSWYDSASSLYYFQDRTMSIEDVREIRKDPVYGGLSVSIVTPTAQSYLQCYFPAAK